MKLKIIFKIVFTILLFIVANCNSEIMNQKLNLDGEWFYKVDKSKIGKRFEWFKVGTIKPDGKIIVPGFFETQIKTEHDGWIWYFREFDFHYQDGKKLALFFEGVDDDAVIWLNEKFVGEHKGYSERFYFDITDKIKEGKNFLAILVNDDGGPGGIYKPCFLKYYEKEEELFETEYSKSYARTSLQWVKEGIIYEIFPRAFSKEGTFKAITKKLPYLKELGVNILWLMPIHPIGKINRKGSLGSPYSVRDYFDVNPEYGSKEDLKELINSAHRLGLKVILDMVLNHCAWDNELVKKYSHWFTKDESGKMIPPNSDWTDVVDFNYDNKELRNYMIEVLKYWVNEFDVDGFRFDVSELVPLDFWEQAREELERIKPQFWLSEGTLPEHHLKAFDMTYSWNIYDLFNPILNGERSPQQLLNSIKLENYTFPKNSLRMRFNENHDKIRAANIFGYDGSLITEGIVFVLNGVPLVHAGQEIGEKYFSSLFEKTEIDWDKYLLKNEHFQVTKKLIELRKRNPWLSLGRIIPIRYDENVLIFMNISSEKGILGIFNFDKNKRSIDLNFINELKDYWIDLTNSVGRKFTIDEERMGRPADRIIDIDSLGFVIFELEKLH